MKTIDRRDLCLSFAATMAFGGAEAGGQASASLATAEVFALEGMAVRKMANGGESRDIVHGALKTGEVVGLHQSVLPAGVAPNAPHTIAHSEFIHVREGVLAFEHDGKAERVGPGGVIFVAYGTLHTLRNVGDVPAKYLVVAIGGDVKA